MYICNCCKNEFFEPVLITEIHYECEDQPKEVFYECPYCTSNDIDKENDYD